MARRREVRVHVVLVKLLVADDDVVAGQLLEAHPLDLCPAHSHLGGAAGGHDVLALVGVAAAGGAEAVAEGVRAGHREDHRARWAPGVVVVVAAGRADASALREGDLRAERR